MKTRGLQIFSSEGLQRLFLAMVTVAGVSIAWATLGAGPRPVDAADDVKLEDESFRIGLPSWVVGDPVGNERAQYRDSSISINTSCPVRKGRLDPNRNPVYVNGIAVGFCCQPCPSTFSGDPERYLREMKVSLKCPVRPGRRALIDSSVRYKVNQDIFFLSSVAAAKQFRKNPLRYVGMLTDPVDHVRFKPTKSSPHVVFRGRDYYFQSGATLAKFQGSPERYFERLAGT